MVGQRSSSGATWHRPPSEQASPTPSQGLSQQRPATQKPALQPLSIAQVDPNDPAGSSEGKSVSSPSLSESSGSSPSELSDEAVSPVPFSGALSNGRCFPWQPCAPSKPAA